MILTPKNWTSFQHYKDREPSWIKLHKSLLTNYEWVCLPVASKALAPMLWLLASEYKDGIIDASLDKLAFRLSMTRGDLANALTPLIQSDFFHASEPLAEGKQDAIPEKEREIDDIEKRESKNETREVALVSFNPNEFAIFWAEWPNKVGKPAAVKALAAARKRGESFEAIMAGVRSYIRDKPPDRSWMNPATFLNGNRWEDQPAKAGTFAKPATAHQVERQTGRDILDDIGKFISSNGGQTDSGLLRHDPGDGPEGLRGGPGGNLIELSASHIGKGS
jgi:hypothetical protein